MLALTTNPGAKDLQLMSDGKEKVYQRVLRMISTWAPLGNLGAVVGATHPQELREIRAAYPAVPLLIPGVGAQGGDIQAITSLPAGSEFAPILVNVSRGILYPDGVAPFPENVLAACHEYHRRLSGG